MKCRKIGKCLQYTIYSDFTLDCVTERLLAIGYWDFLIWTHTSYLLFAIKWSCCTGVSIFTHLLSPLKALLPHSWRNKYRNCSTVVAFFPYFVITENWRVDYINYFVDSQVINHAGLPLTELLQFSLRVFVELIPTCNDWIHFHNIQNQ